MKIYVVTKGIYSDYHICGVAVNRKIAEKIAKYVDSSNLSEYSDKANIEEYETDAWRDVVFSGGIYNVTETSTGKLYAEKEQYDVEELYKTRNKVIETINGTLQTTVLAGDRQHAMKIATDLFAKYKAEKEGIC